MAIYKNIGFGEIRYFPDPLIIRGEICAFEPLGYFHGDPYYAYSISGIRFSQTLGGLKILRRLQIPWFMFWV